MASSPLAIKKSPLAAAPTATAATSICSTAAGCACAKSAICSATAAWPSAPTPSSAKARSTRHWPKSRKSAAPCSKKPPALAAIATGAKMPCASWRRPAITWSGSKIFWPRSPRAWPNWSARPAALANTSLWPPSSDGHLRIWFGHHYHITRNAAANGPSPARDAAAKTLATAREPSPGSMPGPQAASAPSKRLLRQRLAEVLPQRDDRPPRNEDAMRNLAVLRERVTSFDAQVLAARNAILPNSATPPWKTLAVQGRPRHRRCLSAQNKRWHDQANAIWPTKSKPPISAKPPAASRSRAQRRPENADGGECRAQPPPATKSTACATAPRPTPESIEATTHRIDQMADQRERELHGLSAIGRPANKTWPAQQRLGGAARKPRRTTLGIGPHRAGVGPIHLRRRRGRRKADQTHEPVRRDARPAKRQRFGRQRHKANVPGVLGTLGSLIQVLPGRPESGGRPRWAID